MTSLRRFSIVVVALALLGAACSGGDKDIAGVGGATIRLSDVQALYEEDQPVDDAFRDTLFAKIVLETLKQTLDADFGITVDQAEVDAYFAELESAMAQNSATPADLLGVQNASLELVRFNAQVLALRDAALGQLVLAPSTVDSLFADPVTLTSVCARHILVETQDEAEAVLARLEAGEDFGGVAGEVSLDTGSEGGDLGCAPAGDYVDEFARAAVEAPLDEVFGPVETSYGFHLLVVSQRNAISRVEYLADPWGILSQSQLTAIWGDWIAVVVAAADPWVAEEYGIWTPDGIVAPAAATTSTSGG